MQANRPSNSLTMNIRDLLLPALAADALCLGPHWIYSQRQLASIYPNGIEQFDSPRSSYHPGKTAGDLTHYGDQTIALLESIARHGNYTPEDWAADWTLFWQGNTTSYRDGATRDTLSNYQAGHKTPSTSNDLSASARLAPLLGHLRNAPLNERITAARSQNALTHGDPAVIDSAEYFTRLVHHVAETGDILQSLQLACDGQYNALRPAETLAALSPVLELTPPEAARALGLTCHLPEAFPLTLYFLSNYAENPQQALRDNALIGGDNAARGMILGTIFGAAHSTCWLPPHWVSDLHEWERIEDMLLGVGI